MNMHSLISAPLDPRVLLVGEPPTDFGPLGTDAFQERRHFKIETVHCPVKRSSANSLLSKRYGWRGYGAVNLPTLGTDSHVSLAATQDGETIGTMTVGFDGPGQMNSYLAFAPEIRRLRQTSRRLCEFTKLAIDPLTGSKRVLAGLFHVAYIVAYRLRGVDTLVMEVNPRHVRYYQRMLGAVVVGSERPNAKVGAPAVLLSLELSYVRDQIERLSGRPELASTERSLYPLAFTPEDEEGIVSRLKDLAALSSPDHPFTFRLPVGQGVHAS